jgi:hypothetical protein
VTSKHLRSLRCHNTPRSSHARSATVSIVSLLMVAVYPVSGFMRICILQLRLTHRPPELRTRIGLCARTYPISTFHTELYHFISDQFHINHLQHLRTREAVRAISASSSHMHVTRMADCILLFLTDTPTPFSCLSIIVSRSVIRVVPVVQSKSGCASAAVAAQKPQRTSCSWKARSSRNKQ